MTTDTGPVLTVVRGEPTAEQLAALVAVLSAPQVELAQHPAAGRSLWATPVLRAVEPAGPGAWRATSLPR